MVERTWSEQQKLKGMPGSKFGISVALAADGRTMAVGASEEYGSRGGVWVFVNSDGTWVQQGDLLVGNPSGSFMNQGAEIAISADGNILAFGVTLRSDVPGSGWDNRGCAYVFARSGNMWTQQAYLPGDGNYFTGDYNVAVGNAVALDSVGATLAMSDEATVFVFVRSGESWSLQQKIWLGWTPFTVSLSGDGNTLAVAGSAALIFARASGAWTLHTWLAFGLWSGKAALATDGKTLAMVCQKTSDR
jgi:hypothetical protein